MLAFRCQKGASVCRAIQIVNLNVILIVMSMKDGPIVQPNFLRRSSPLKKKKNSLSIKLFVIFFMMELSVVGRDLMRVSN
jgi:hypothetical protein